MSGPVAKAADIPIGTVKIVQAGKYRIALCNVDGTFYAIEDVCTHDDGPLGEGQLDGCKIECPRHGAKFDVRNGSAVQMPAIIPVKTFPVKVEGDDIFIEVSVG